MNFPPTLIFSLSIFITFLVYNYFGKSYALDRPDYRKRHHNNIPQIGGLVFSLFYLLIGLHTQVLPGWYMSCGLVSIILGGFDDVRNVSWKFKLIIQLSIAFYIAFIFWGRFDTITFYEFSIPISQILLFAVFLIWFIGIYNAINLIDGLDGLAGGFFFLLCIGTGISSNGSFSQLNIYFSVIILGFLIFNQRPAKLFMGDAGSLFLGFHTAVLPLLFVENITKTTNLDMTPFVLLTSFLIADTTRVFFTRLFAKQSPMTADTIHFHHLILQQSGSYLASIGSIYLVMLVSMIVAIFSFQVKLSINIMLGHLGLLLLFILTPPVETYVPIISRAINPIAMWQKKNNEVTVSYIRTFFVLILFIGLILSLIFHHNLASGLSLEYGFSILLLLIVIYYFRKNILSMYVIQLGLTLLFTEAYFNSEFGTLTKLFITFFLITYIIFIVEIRTGCNINDFSCLDIIMILITVGGTALSIMGLAITTWFFLALFSFWFALRFLLLRTFYLSL